MSVSEAREIVAGCKRLEKENWRQAHWELQNRFSALQVDSTLSATTRPFQLQATLQSSREDDGPQAYPSRSRWAGSHPTSGLTVGSPVRRMSLGHPHCSDDDGVSSDASNQDRPLFGGKKGHPHDVADAFRQWACCITYYRDYYEDAAGQRWVAQLASYNFALEYQKGKKNTVADLLSHLDDRLPPGKVQDYLNKIPYPGVKAVLDNAITPLTERAEQGVRPNPDNQKAGQEVTVGARPARLATTNITNWKLEQQEDPVLYQVVKHRKAS